MLTYTILLSLLLFTPQEFVNLLTYQSHTSHEVAFHLDRAEFTDVFDQSVLSMTNEQTIATALLNHELGEYTTKVTVYTPHGDKITFE